MTEFREDRRRRRRDDGVGDRADVRALGSADAVERPVARRRQSAQSSACMACSTGACRAASGRRRRPRRARRQSLRGREPRSLRRLRFRHRGCIRGRGAEARSVQDASTRSLRPKPASPPTPHPFPSRRLSAAVAEPRRERVSSARISSRPSRGCGSSKSSRPPIPIPPLSTPSSTTMIAIGKAPIRVKDVVGLRGQPPAPCARHRVRSASSRRASARRPTSTRPASSASATRSARLNFSTTRRTRCRSACTRFSIRPMASASCRARCSARWSQPATTAAKPGVAGTDMIATASGCDLHNR